MVEAGTELRWGLDGFEEDVGDDRGGWAGEGRWECGYLGG
jgi:hypothetical protein